MFFLCSVYVLVYFVFMFDLFFVDDLRMALFLRFFGFFFMLVCTKKRKKIKIRPYANN